VLLIFYLKSADSGYCCDWAYGIITISFKIASSNPTKLCLF